MILVLVSHPTAHSRVQNMRKKYFQKVVLEEKIYRSQHSTPVVISAGREKPPLHPTENENINKQNLEKEFVHVCVVVFIFFIPFRASPKFSGFWSVFLHVLH